MEYILCSPAERCSVHAPVMYKNKMTARFKYGVCCLLHDRYKNDKLNLCRHSNESFIVRGGAAHIHFKCCTSTVAQTCTNALTLNS